MIKIGNIFREWGKDVIIVVVSASIGWVSASYTDFLKDSRQSVQLDFVKLNDSSSDLLQTLDIYAKRAKTGAPVDDKTQEHFRQTILALYNRADLLAKHEPRVHEEFTSYARALLELQGAAEALGGPLDGQRFVEATSTYLDADSKFKARITSIEGSYLRSLL